MPEDIKTYANISPGGASVASTGLGAVTSVVNTTMTNKANRKLAEYSYSKDLEMWNKANEYNSPANQMKRLAEAGLNPNLVYGNGVTGNTSSSLPKYQAPVQQYSYKPPFDPASMLSLYMDMETKKAQIDNVKAQTAIAISEAAIRKVEAEYAPFNKEIDWEKNVRSLDQQRLNYKFSQLDFEAAKKLRPLKIEESQADVKRKNIDNEIRNWELKFRDMGGPFWGNIISFIRLLKK